MIGAGMARFPTGFLPHRDEAGRGEGRPRTVNPHLPSSSEVNRTPPVRPGVVRGVWGGRRPASGYFGVRRLGQRATVMRRRLRLRLGNLRNLQSPP